MTYLNVIISIISNQISSIMHFNNITQSAPTSKKVPVASLLCRYGAGSALYGVSAGPYRLISQKAKTIT